MTATRDDSKFIEFIPSFSNVKYEIIEDNTVFRIGPDDSQPSNVTLADLTVPNTASVEEVADLIEKHGACIIKNYLPIETVDAVLKDIDYLFDQDKPWGGDGFPKETRRVSNLVVKSKVVAEEILCHEMNKKIVDKFLTRASTVWYGEKLMKIENPPHHSCTLAFKVGPGARNQSLHRDGDLVHQTTHSKRTKFEYGLDTLVGNFVALTKTTKENGATRIIPGSHLWGHYRAPKESETVAVELEKGDGFFTVGSIYHGGSANTTKDEYRTMLACFSTVGTLRPEENIYFGTPIDYFKDLSVEANIRLGNARSGLAGFVDMIDPIQILFPGLEREPDPFAGEFKVENVKTAVCEN